MAALLWKDPDTGALNTFEFDATTSEDPTDAITITDHPVEEGTNVVDHARPDPERITLEGIITDTPHHGNLGDDDNYTDQPLSLSVDIMGPPGTQTIHLDVPDPPVEISESGLIRAGVSALGNAIFGGPNNDATAWGVPNRKTLSASATALQAVSQVSRSRREYEKLLAAKDVTAVFDVVTSRREYFDMLIERIGAPRTPEDGDGLKFSIDLRRLRIAASQTVDPPQPTEARGAKAKSMGSQTTKDDPNADKKFSSILNDATEPLF